MPKIMEGRSQASVCWSRSATPTKATCVAVILPKKATPELRGIVSVTVWHDQIRYLGLSLVFRSVAQ